MNVQRKIMPGRIPSPPKLSADILRRLRGVASGAATAAVSNTLLLTGSSASTVAAAEALAQETGRKLVHIDLSAVSSQSIGETEKNLDRLLANVDPAHSILIFDEADALFGKRTDVADAHDRYANVELSWLLERIESFPTLAVFSRSSDDELPLDLHFSNHILLPH